MVDGIYVLTADCAEGVNTFIGLFATLELAEQAAETITFPITWCHLDAQSMQMDGVPLHGADIKAFWIRWVPVNQQIMDGDWVGVKIRA